MREETIVQLRKISTPKQFVKDDYICNEGQPGNEMYIILKGSVGVFVTNAIGTLTYVATIGAGDFFGEMAIFDNLPRSASCIALEDTLCVAINEENIDRFLKMVDDPYNCLTLCSGSLNANPENNVAKIVRKHCDRIAFAHIRNVKHFENGDFSEASHRDCDGDTGILEILKAYHDCGFKGYIRPDHGRHLWDEGPGNVRPGYGLYDRALGIMYMLGVWDSLEKFEG